MCSNPEVVNKTSYALEVATTVLAFYETFYGVPYPLEKQGTCVLSPGRKKQGPYGVQPKIYFELLHAVSHSMHEN